MAWSVDFGTCPITLAVIWGVFWGLLVGQDMGFRNIWLETDSSSVYNLINQGATVTHTYSLVDALRNLLNEDWNIEFRHIFHEANMCVDV